MSSFGERQADFDFRILSTGDGRALPVQRSQMSPENVRLTMRALEVLDELPPEVLHATLSILHRRLVKKDADA
jgi:hypothetical protein